MPKTETLPREVLQFVTDRGIGERIHDVLELTQRMFPGEVCLEVDADPEWPAETYLVLNVQASGELKEIIEHQCEWHQELMELIPTCLHSLRLSITLL